jgi:predicted nucleic acid-binding protein
MAWLLDTNIISETRRLNPEPKVLAFIADHPLEDLYISTVTLADKRRDELNEWLTHEIRPMFDRRVLPITEDVMLRWRMRKAGRRDTRIRSQT